MAIKVNRINRNFGIKVHLYYNSTSYNRPSDSTPRFYLKPVELLSVERVAFTHKSKEKGYGEYGNRFWKWRGEDKLTQAEILSIYEEIKNSFPYGYVEGDTASTNKYIFDVKENESFQSFYKTYWENNLSKVKQQNFKEDGTADYPHPYIEFNTNEIITYKHNVGTVPALPSSQLSYEYEKELAEYYSEPVTWSCSDETSDVYYFNNRFAPNSIDSLHMIFGITGQRYTFDLKNWSGVFPWPTGEDGSYSGYRFRFSTGENGSWDGFDEHTTNVKYVLSPETSHYYVKAGTKTNGQHPYYGQGSATGYLLSGYDGTATGYATTWAEGPAITLRRESTYRFLQYDGSNSGHPIYIATNPAGGGDYSFSSGVSYHVVNAYKPGYTGDGNYPYMEFIVPTGAPNTLYYG